MKLNVNRGWIIPSAVLFIVIAQVLTVREGHNWGGDFAQYILHARNIVEGRPYAQTGYIYNPSNPFPSKFTNVAGFQRYFFVREKIAIKRRITIHFRL